ncbi:MAG: sigma-70 region 4 domain-containing protein [Desulfofustis sp. PB-SRB1]|nr:sigma-70 region 4 domain-containing protein [Desulfofustis sp. PB-SRB1]
MDRLPGSYREIITFRDLLGLNTQEIGERLELSPDAVRVRLHRARKRLKEMIDANCEVSNGQGNFFVLRLEPGWPSL